MMLKQTQGQGCDVCVDVVSYQNMVRNENDRNAS